MQVIRAKVMGYCFGVQRAIDMALGAAQQNAKNNDEKKSKEKSSEKSQKVWTLGPLIHNQNALDFLAQHDVHELDMNALDAFAKSNAEKANDVVIIRAHGAEQKKQLRLREYGFTVLDATCPRVKASQELAQKYSASGYDVLIAGDKKHGEVIGIASFVTASNVFIFQNADEVSALHLTHVINKEKQYVLLAQTTIRQSEYEAIAAALKKIIPEKNIAVCATICPATKERQEALADLCTRVDGVLVIGGKDSANTQRLLTCAFSHNVPACLISSSAEIPQAFFSMTSVGLTAGASTPNEVIDAVEKRLLESG
ncbi:MAG: 4-hydroxy-3-methylbut-2-enyl diphosphate reductase [Treponemataceae bacterium]|nr:MAG: 4-hydroxy-3-methylbut-2-enyl diphosphate reductase [Treponemataceae bacterium]